MDGTSMVEYGHPGIEVKNYMPSTGMGASEAALLANQGGLFGGSGGGLLGGLLFGSLLTGRGFGGWGGWGGGVGGPGANAVATDVVLNPAFQSIQNQISSISDQLNTASTNNGIVAVSQAIDNNARALQSAIADVSTAQASGNFTTLQSINGLGATITAQNNQGALSNLNSFNNLTTTTLQGFNEVARDQASAFNQIIMGQNAMAAQNAACCCDIKAAIAADGNATRALINDLHTQDLVSQLNDAKNQISNTNQTIALENFIATRLPTNGAAVVV